MGRIGKVFILLLFIAYPILLHIFVLKDEVEVWHLVFVFAPLLLGVGWVIFGALARIWWPLLGLLLAALIYYVIAGEHGRVGLLAVNGLSHASLNLFLLWFFGRTLLPGREALISQISRHMNGKLDQEIADYTRNVTIAWCIFFCGQVVISFLLYMFVSLAAWSFFINVLNVPLLGAMFIGEHVYRAARYPKRIQTSIMKEIEVFTKDFSAPKNAGDKR